MNENSVPVLLDLRSSRKYYWIFNEYTSMFAKAKALNENKTSKQLERVARLKKKSVVKTDSWKPAKWTQI